jgi:NADP-dependent aldehyde dehydrogenase
MLHTANRIGYELSQLGTETFRVFNPYTQTELPGDFAVATVEEVNRAAEKAWQAWQEYRYFSGRQKAVFLRAIAAELEALGDELVLRVMEETALPRGRVEGERGRTCGQLRMFADLVEEGSWVQAIIDTALPERQPLPRVDIRNMLQSTGPVVVFTASNFPLAFSTAGGDTAAALAAGCPVIVKAHASHAGTHALVSGAILKAAREAQMPDGVFSALQDSGIRVGTQLVQHPRVQSVAFTGSFQGGMALFKAAQQRHDPIPVFAEMGSVNPVFVLPGKLQQEASQLAAEIAGSVNLGAGQFCTNPGIVVVQEGPEADVFVDALKQAFATLVPSVMLNRGIYDNYQRARAHCLNVEGVQVTYMEPSRENERWEAYPAVAHTTGANFLAQPALQEEVFGPFTLLVRCSGKAEMLAVAESFKGQLTATVFGVPAELPEWRGLVTGLAEKVGRLIFNGVPTGVEVGHAMQHGGPFPAATDGRFTSVGSSAIRRFVRPVAYQNWPDEWLPPALQEANPLGIARIVNGKWVLP